MTATPISAYAVRMHQINQALLRGQKPSDYELNAFLGQLALDYEASDGPARQELRQLLSNHKDLTWAALRQPREMGPEAFRIGLLLFSLRNQGTDARDESLFLGKLCRRARAAGIDADTTLSAVAGLSADEDLYNMGSTKDFLLRQLRHPDAPGGIGFFRAVRRWFTGR